jgi:hypothetical protein
MMSVIDRSWFDECRDYYLERSEFVRYQKVAGVDFRDLFSDDLKAVDRAQRRIAEQSVVVNEVRKEHAGFGMPFIAYTHDLGFGDSLPGHCEELDRLILAEDMTDSLRRRHIALSHALLPTQLKELYRDFGEQPLTVLNLGSGVGLDVINALQACDGLVARALNYDINRAALSFGRLLTATLVEEGRFPAGVSEYRRGSLMKCREQGHLALLVGIICGLEDDAALAVLRRVYDMLHPGGRLLVTSSNFRMLCHSPLASFIIQHIGSVGEPQRHWGLNCRSREAMSALVAGAGFTELLLCDDHNFPGRDELPGEVLEGVDALPSRILGLGHSGRPLVLPGAEVRRRREGYNWLVVAEKPA